LNAIFGAGGGESVRVGALYLLMVAAVWCSGMAQARDCLDPEARRTPLRLADAAVLLLLFALVPFALDRGLGKIGVAREATALTHVVVLALFGAAAARMLRAPGAASAARRGLGLSVVIGLLCGVGTRAARRLLFGAGPVLGDGWAAPGVMLLLVAVTLSEELVLRGVVQGALERASRPLGRAAPWIAAVAGVVVAQLTAPAWTPLLLLLALGPAVARASTGRLLAAFVARLLILLAGT